MYYLVIGKEDSAPLNNTFKYFFEGSFTSDELKSKAIQAYKTENELIEVVDPSDEESIILINNDTTMTFDLSVWYVFKSDQPITQI